MQETYYIKKGRRYVPVGYYDSNVLDAMPKGHHLITVTANGRSGRYDIDPALAPLIAASITAENAIVKELIDQQRLRPYDKKLTPEQHSAWLKLIEVIDDTRLIRNSAADVARAATQALINEADKLLKNPAVRSAYEEFVLLAKLTKSDGQ